jgi:hypothetical protein
MTAAIECPTPNAKILVVLQREIALVWEDQEAARVPGTATTYTFRYPWAGVGEKFRVQLRRQCVSCELSDSLSSDPVTIP